MFFQDQAHTVNIFAVVILLKKLFFASWFLFCSSELQLE